MRPAGEDAVRTLTNLTFSFTVSMALSAAVELNLADIIAAAGEDATLSAEEIAAKLPTDKASVTNLKRLLRLLVLHDIFKADHGSGSSWESLRYGLTPISHLLVSGAAVCLAPVIRMQVHRNTIVPWLHLHEAVLSDAAEPFSLANEGKDIWTVGKEDEQFSKIVNEAMASASGSVMDAFLSEYKGFQSVSGVVADVGGGTGTWLRKIIETYPHIRGINFDLPNVVATAPQIPGVTHVGGDMFESVPQADAFSIKCTLQDWPDDKCIRVLKNCWNSLPAKEGKVVIVEMVVPPLGHQDAAELQHAVTVDLAMLALASDGKGRTASEWEALSAGSGFAQVTFFPLSGAYSAIELHKSSVIRPPFSP